jgi:hypothetical protein
MKWTTVETPFFLQKGQNLDNIKLNLVVNGKGTVWIVDIKLIKGPLQQEVFRQQHCEIKTFKQRIPRCSAPGLIFSHTVCLLSRNKHVIFFVDYKFTKSNSELG